MIEYVFCASLLVSGIDFFVPTPLRGVAITKFCELLTGGIYRLASITKIINLMDRYCMRVLIYIVNFSAYNAALCGYYTYLVDLIGISKLIIVKYN